MIPCYETHGSRQRINKQFIQEEYKIWVPVAEVHGYVVQFRQYRETKKGKQIASSTKWGLGENVVLRLMEYLTAAVSFYIYMDQHLSNSYAQQTAAKKCLVGQNISSAVYIASESCEPKTFVRCWKKVERNYI